MSSSAIVRVNRDDLQFLQDLCARARRATTYLDRIGLFGAMQAQIERLLRSPTVIPEPESPSPTQYLPFGVTRAEMEQVVDDIQQNNYLPTPPALVRTSSMAPPAIRRAMRRLRVDTADDADEEATEVVEPPTEEEVAAAGAAGDSPPPRRRRRSQ